MKVTLDGQLRRCADNRSAWLDLMTSHCINRPNPASGPQPVTAAASPLPNPSPADPVSNGPMPTVTLNCVADSLMWLSRGRDSRLVAEADSSVSAVHDLPDCLQSAEHIQLLCVGSLHLVGDVLSLLDPCVCDK